MLPRQDGMEVGAEGMDALGFGVCWHHGWDGVRWVGLMWDDLAWNGMCSCDVGWVCLIWGWLAQCGAGWSVVQVGVT